MASIRSAFSGVSLLLLLLLSSCATSSQSGDSSHAPPSGTDPGSDSQDSDDDDSSGDLEEPEDVEDPEDSPLPDPYSSVRRLRIHTEQSPSWVAWAEVEVIGTWAGQDMDPIDLRADAAVSSSSQTPSGPAHYALDGDLSTAWNAGAFAPAWLEIELSAPAIIHTVRLRTAQSPPGPTRHLLQFGQTSGTLETMKVFEAETHGGTWLVYTTPGVGEGDGACEPLQFNLLMEQTTQACRDCQIWFWGMGVPEQRPRLEVQYTDSSGAHNATFQAGPLGSDGDLWATRILAENPWWGPGSCSPGDASCIANFLHHLEARGTLEGAPLWHGLLYSDLSLIPCNATIDQARLHLHINEDEGLANSDHTSVVSFYRGSKPWDPGTVHAQRYATDPDTGQDLAWDTPGGDFGEFVLDLEAQRDFWDRGFHKANPAAWFEFTSHLSELQQERQTSGGALPADVGNSN